LDIESKTGQRNLLGLSTGRIEAFSDGVFAIAVTLLILDIKVPSAADTARGGLLRALRDEWPAYFAFATSFVTILIMWMNHHYVFSNLRRGDHWLFLLNGLLLLCVTFIPFPTALLAAYVGHQGEHVAAAVYAGSFVVTAIAFNGLWRYIVWKNEFLAPEMDAGFRRTLSLEYLAGPPLYLVAFVLALVHVGASLFVCAGLAMLFALPVPLGRVNAT
jgi:uncharacterized membrane protein